MIFDNLPSDFCRRKIGLIFYYILLRNLIKFNENEIFFLPNDKRLISQKNE